MRAEPFCKYPFFFHTALAPNTHGYTHDEKCPHSRYEGLFYKTEGYVKHLDKSERSTESEEEQHTRCALQLNCKQTLIPPHVLHANRH